MYRDLCYPTDGSDGADAALEDAQDIARHYDATVHVLSVVNTAEEGGGLGTDPNQEPAAGMVGDPAGGSGGMVGRRETMDDQRSELEERAGRLAREVAGRFEGVETEPAVSVGEPAEEIVDYSTAADVDLVVMGTHGRTGLDRYLVGSVTEAVVRRSDVPVLTVRADAEG